MEQNYLLKNNQTVFSERSCQSLVWFSSFWLVWLLAFFGHYFSFKLIWICWCKWSNSIRFFQKALQSELTLFTYSHVVSNPVNARTDGSCTYGMCRLNHFITYLGWFFFFWYRNELGLQNKKFTAWKEGLHLKKYSSEPCNITLSSELENCS